MYVSFALASQHNAIWHQTMGHLLQELITNNNLQQPPVQPNAPYPR